MERRYQKTDNAASRSLSLHLGMTRSLKTEMLQSRSLRLRWGKRRKQLTEARQDLAAGLEISSKAADIWVQTDEISCMMTEITTYAKKKANILGGETAVGSCWEALTRDHVLLLPFGCPSADKMVRRTRPSLWATRQPRGASGTLETVRLAALFSGRRCGRDLGWVRKQMQFRVNSTYGLWANMYHQ